MALLGCYQWKAIAEVETQLVTKNAAGTSACPVTFIITCFKYMFKKLKILLHDLQVKPLSSKADKIMPVFNNKIAGKCELVLRILKNFITTDHSQTGYEYYYQESCKRRLPSYDGIGKRACGV